MQVHLTRVSSNRKTGPIPVSTTTATSCPPDCPFARDCYAKQQPLRGHWDQVTDGRRGGAWHEFCRQIAALPKAQLWRHNQAGDLPGVGNRISKALLRMLTAANRGRRGFTYTHKRLTPANLALIREANANGFTINASANTLAQADDYLKLGIPVVVVVPSDAPVKGLTPGGNRYVVCPAQIRDDVTCATCGLCQMQDDRRPVIAFQAHGSATKRIDARLKS